MIGPVHYCEILDHGCRLSPFIILTKRDIAKAITVFGY